MRKVQLSFAAALALSGILLAVLALNGIPRMERENQASSAVQPSNSATAAAVTENRRVYRNSVVPGGVYSHTEAQAAAQRDEVVRAHYRPVNLQRLRPVVLDRPVDRYVSFRKNGKVYWTSQRMRIPAGELLLADSDSLIRARCGNRLADSPQSPTVPAHVDEPADSELSSIEEREASEYIASTQRVLPIVPAANRGSAGMPQALMPLPGAGAVAAAAAVMNPDTMIYGGSDVLGGGMPAPGAPPSSITESATLTAPQVPVEIPRFEGTVVAPVDPTQVAWGGIPSYVPAVAPVTAPGDPWRGNSGASGSSSLAGGTSAVSPAVPLFDPHSGYFVSNKPTLPSSLVPVSTSLSGSEPGFKNEVPEPSTLGLCLGGLALFVCCAGRARLAAPRLSRQTVRRVD